MCVPSFESSSQWCSWWRIALLGFTDGSESQTNFQRLLIVFKSAHLVIRVFYRFEETHCLCLMPWMMFVSYSRSNSLRLGILEQPRSLPVLNGCLRIYKIIINPQKWLFFLSRESPRSFFQDQHEIKWASHCLRRERSRRYLSAWEKGIWWK